MFLNGFQFASDCEIKIKVENAIVITVNIQLSEIAYTQINYLIILYENSNILSPKKFKRFIIFANLFKKNRKSIAVIFFP